MTYLEQLQLRDAPPADEVCHCSGRTALHLRYEFSEFPLFCTDCTGQILPSALCLSEDLAGEILGWRTVYAALYDLWLDSSEYEVFARAALVDPGGNVNQHGLTLAARLSEQRTTFYWWYRDDGESETEDRPLCRSSMVEHPTWRFRFCHACRISA